MKSVKYGDFSGSNTGKYGPEKTPYLDSFHTVKVEPIQLFVTGNAGIKKSNLLSTKRHFLNKSLHTIVAMLKKIEY